METVASQRIFGVGFQQSVALHSAETEAVFVQPVWSERLESQSGGEKWERREKSGWQHSGSVDIHVFALILCSYFWRKWNCGKLMGWIQIILHANSCGYVVLYLRLTSLHSFSLLSWLVGAHLALSYLSSALHVMEGRWIFFLNILNTFKCTLIVLYWHHVSHKVALKEFCITLYKVITVQTKLFLPDLTLKITLIAVVQTVEYIFWLI